jgi:hypothetical protein
VISIRQSNGGVTFAVKVHLRAKENAISGELDNALKVLPNLATRGRPRQ